MAQFVLRDNISHAVQDNISHAVQDDISHAGQNDVSHAGRDGIPNLVHFVYVLKDPKADFGFQFSDYLSIFAAKHYWAPQKIYLHTNALDGSITRARNGQAGKWSQLIFRIPGVVVNIVEAPTRTNTGTEIIHMAHRSDFVRVKAVRDFGGVYIDFDAHPLRDIKVLRESGFRAIGGRQKDGDVMSGTFMSAKGGKMIEQWTEQMHPAFDGKWATHSNQVITKIGEKLIAEPGEMLIMERAAFGPLSWEDNDVAKLYDVHNDITSAIENLTQGDPLPVVDNNRPTWARDWSSSYILHAFKGSKKVYNIKGHKGITPRYILERQSNFARAVYPIANVMYERGLISLNDTNTGK
ncbi:glycosyl transferase [Drechmeria coniospora]|uniref:Glycosyl transferase n=1 Tax=Drechmeria coniospora TaxID=98403 RepID=A0A151GP52_DRECN|nr:glycosyl transferase [Drechmeria coniospora]KYK58841.1 glycosyl transferase [Drechmeria coniospora]